jgi:acetyl coenzyme A synthetase (ADP forming)-like protein
MNLLEADFRGPVFPINPREKVVQSIRAYRTISEVPDPVDLAVIVVPKNAVLTVAKECGQRGVKGLVVISAGFKETGEEGLRREEALEEIIRRYEMRMVGPNCMGVINTDPKIRLDASFSKAKAIPGSIAMLSQSGALGEVILDYAGQMDLGLSMFASVGNKTDISGNDLLRYWEKDPNTEIILLYLESFGDPREFTQIARRITRKKPIVAVKAGRSVSGAAAITSHTGTMAESDIATDALFEQCGVIRVNSVRELFDVALALQCQKPPKGRRLAIITNAGGPGILATDAAVSRGFEMAQLSPARRRHLAKKLPAEASTRNPVDLLASATHDEYEVALKSVLRDPDVDAALVIFVPPIMVDAPAVGRVIVEAAQKHPDVPLVGCFMRPPEGMRDVESFMGCRVPFYPFPEEAVFSLDTLARYGEWLRRPKGRPLHERVRLRHGRKIDAILTEARRTGSLTVSRSMEFLRHVGLPVADFTSGAWDERDALPEAAEKLGYPVVLKADLPSAQHKTERKLVRLNLSSEEDVLNAARQLQKAAPESEGWFLQQQVPHARELILGMTTHGTFGPLFVLGLGGMEVEVLADVAFRLHPLTAHDVQEMAQSLRSYPLIRGYRGGPVVSLGDLKDLMAKLSKLVEEHPEIVSLEVNPLMVLPGTAKLVAVDARVVLAEEA